MAGAKGKKKTARKKVTKKKAPAKKKRASRGMAAKKRAAPKKRAVKKVARKAKPKVKRAPNPAFMRPWTVSEDLGAVIGMSPKPRTEVTKKLWDYIKRNSLQDTVNRRMINPDEKLRKVFGGKTKVSMFEMTKLISKHLK